VITEHITDIKVLAKTIEQETQHECRATELGHIQRGGAPTACDRMMATQFGDFAIQLIKKEVGGVCVGVDANKLIYNDINRAIDHKPHHFNQTLYDLSKRLF
jgi:6-phosphofructokinase 1